MKYSYLYAVKHKPGVIGPKKRLARSYKFLGKYYVYNLCTHYRIRTRADEQSDADTKI